MIAPRKDPYDFDEHFERAVLTLAASVPAFYGTVGHVLDPECMGLPEAKLILEILALMYREKGSTPSSVLLVVQRLRRRMAEGKITLEAVKAAAAVFDAAEDYGLPDAKAVADELTPLLRRRAQSEAIMLSHDEYARRGNFKVVREHLERAERIGMASINVGTNLTAGFAEISQIKALERLPTGVLPLDVQLNEGLARGQMGVALGGSGDGKSMFLSSQASEAIRRQHHTVYASLELPRTVILARIQANLTGVPVNQILEHAGDRAEAERRMNVMSQHIGACFVEEFSPHATTVNDIKDWVERCEQQLGAPVGLVAVDYGDLLYDPRIKGDNEYIAMRYVFEGLRRDIAVPNRWLWTAAQAGRPSKDMGKRLDLQHVSDSMHKVRVADLVLTLNARDDGAQLLYYVAKNRTGKARMQVGPEPTDFERGRIAPLASEWMVW